MMVLLSKREYDDLEKRAMAGDVVIEEKVKGVREGLRRELFTLHQHCAYASSAEIVRSLIAILEKNQYDPRPR
jgi:hypothetical protein